jgi:hypothetical protein
MDSSLCNANPANKKNMDEKEKKNPTRLTPTGKNKKIRRDPGFRPYSM